MGKPNAIWRLASALYSIVKAKELLYQCAQNGNDAKIRIKYIFEEQAAPVELALIVDDKLSIHAYVAERIVEFTNKNLSGDENFKEVLNDPYRIKQYVKRYIRVYDIEYAAILKLLSIELKKLKLDIPTIKQNAHKILNENDPYFEPVIKYFQEEILKVIKTQCLQKYSS